MTTVNARDPAWAGGAIGDGVHDDTAAVQAAADYITGPGAAVSVARDVLSTIFLPAGKYKLTSPITVRSERGFKLVGAGAWATQFLPAATMSSVFDLNGIYAAEIGGFSVRPDLQGATKVDNVFDLYWDSATSARSSQLVQFRDITIDCTFTTSGFRTAKNGNAPQVDSIEFHRCQVYGGWAGSGTDYQHGFFFGSGGAGNALCHWMYGCDFNGTRYGVRTEGVSTHVYGWQQAVQNGDATFYISGGPRHFSVQGGRTEGSKRLLDSTAFGSLGLVSLRDCEHRAEFLHADGYFISLNAGMHMLIENCSSLAAGSVPRINAGGTNLMVTINGLTVNDSPLNNLFNVSSTAEVEARGLTNLNGTTLVATERPRGVWRRMTGVIGQQELWGTGSPETVITAQVGSVYHRTDGGAGTCLYIKESGTAATGWIGK